MRKTYWTLVVAFSATLAVAVACSEPAELGDKEGEDGPGGVNELSTRDLCVQYCQDLAECAGTGNGGGSAEDIEGDCRDSCLGAAEEAADDECTSSFRVLLECVAESFSCSLVTGSGDFPCGREQSEYLECATQGSGPSGS